MSRYLERAENTARILEVNQTLLLDFDVPLEQQWKPLLIISGIHDMPGEPDAEARRLYERHRSEFYNQIKRVNQLLHGITDSTMSHDEPWEFIQLGKYLERACQTARILDAKYHILLPTPEHVGTPIDSAHWVAILTSCS